MRTGRVPWTMYLGDIVIGIRAGEGATQLAKRINEKFGEHLRDTNFYGAMRQRDTLNLRDGPLICLLREQYPDEAPDLIRRFDNRVGLDSLRGLVPRWKKKLTADQLRAFEELADEPAIFLTFRCSLLVVNAETQIEESCGALSYHPFCRKHRLIGTRWMVEEIAHAVRCVV